MLVVAKNCAVGTLSLSATKTSSFSKSSTSFPFGARVIKSTSPICKSSFKMSSPPLSPSTNAVVVLFLLNSPID